MSYLAFKKLHKENELLLLGNVWDAQSSKIAEKVGFKALGLSSHAIANLFGYEDGENISPDEILYMVKRIMNVIKVPLSVDYESGYTDDPHQVAKYVKELQDAGVAGINLEDGKVIEGKRVLGDAKLLADKIREIRKIAPEIYINARADTYTTKHPNALEETIKRAKIYEEAGAHGLFVPLAVDNDDLKALANASTLDLNIFMMPGIASPSELLALGVRRVSHGPKIWEHLLKVMEDSLRDVFTAMKLPQ